MQDFSLFSVLPTELRLKIWHLALIKQRIIKLRLRNRLLMDGLLARQGGSRPQTHSDESYGVVIDGYQIISKLFRVNRDSRYAAMAFYRVQFPCWLVKGATKDDAMCPGTLYMNPEHDFLYISNDTGQVVDFLHDLKTAHDPLKRGLLNLAIDANGLTGIFGLSSIDLHGLDPLSRKSFTNTLTQLQQVYFVQVQATGRHVFGYRSGALTSENMLNLSFPIAAMALNFDFPRPDIRSIRRDLGKVFVNIDPRGMICAWGRLFHDWFGGNVIPETEYRVLLTFAPSTNDIYNREDAELWLQREHATWIDETSKESESSWQVSGDSSEDVAETAFGFWLFPVQAFGPLPEKPTDIFTSERPSVMDLTEYWPDIALLDLPL